MAIGEGKGVGEGDARRGRQASWATWANVTAANATGVQSQRVLGAAGVEGDVRLG